MKLFVWRYVLYDYNSGIMIAIAPTVEEARAQLLRDCSYIPLSDLEKEPEELELSETRAFAIWGSS